MTHPLDPTPSAPEATMDETTIPLPGGWCLRRVENGGWTIFSAEGHAQAFYCWTDIAARVFAAAMSTDLTAEIAALKRELADLRAGGVVLPAELVALIEAANRDILLDAGRTENAWKLANAAVNFVRTLAAGRSARGEADGWRPISTAPKDGTSVLLYSEAWEDSWGIQIGHHNGEGWRTPEGFVEENEPDFDPDAEVPEDTEIDPEANLGPTHWRPLPPAPTTTEPQS